MTPTPRRHGATPRIRTIVAAVTAALLLGPALVPDAGAAVLCQRKNRIKVRPEVCKKKETLIQDLGTLGTGLAGQTGRIDKIVQQFRLECVGAPNLVEATSKDSLYFDSIDCAGGCRTHDGDQTACEGAWAISNKGATSCFYFKGLCLPCAGCGEDAGVCDNTCRAPSAPVTCPNDPTRTIFVGPSGTAACQSIDNQTECEQAYHESSNGSPASCYWTGAACRGCGPSNENDQSCTNTCRTVGCADPARTTLVRCTNLGTDEAACAQAWHLTGNEGEPASCYFTGGQCRGCGFPNELAGDCDNTCRPAAP
jgi:hypothetical protein